MSNQSWKTTKRSTWLTLNSNLIFLNKIGQTVPEIECMRTLVFVLLFTFAFCICKANGFILTSFNYKRTEYICNHICQLGYGTNEYHYLFPTHSIQYLCMSDAFLFSRYVFQCQIEELVSIAMQSRANRRLNDGYFVCRHECLSWLEFSWFLFKLDFYASTFRRRWFYVFWLSVCPSV